MPRTVQDTNVATRSARLRLKPSDTPYYRGLDPGLSLGYRRHVDGGRWVVRVRIGKAYKLETIGTADDIADADGVAVLSFAQAQEKARQRRVELVRVAEGLPEQTGPYTVRNALDDYLAWMSEHRRSARGARWAAEAFILPKLGDTEVAKLTALQIRKWHSGIADSPPRARSKKGKAARHHKVDLTDADAKRRRRSTANGVLTILRAALNRAWREGNVASDTEWRRVKPFPRTDQARARYLAAEECRRLINASPPGFRELLEGALLTGCRYAELAAFRVFDFNPDVGTVTVRDSKTGKARHVVLNDEGVDFFKRRALGKLADALLLPRADGQPWLKSHQARPMREACKAANITPAANFHITRHTWASLTVMAGAPLLVVAKNLGHTDTRMVERHYGHLAPSYVADEIRRAAPRFGIVADGNVVPMRAVTEKSPRHRGEADK